MSLQPYQLSALAQMGIPVWERRSAQSDAVHAGVTEALSLNPGSNCLLLIDNDALVPAQQKLLAAMLRAINVDLSQLTWLNTTHVEAIKNYTGQPIVLLVCGFQSIEQLALTTEPVQSLNRDVVAATLPDLDLMLSEPSRKADAWLALKQVQAQVKLYA